MAVTAVQILNTIRDQLGEDYASRIPLATKNNIADIGKKLSASDITMNDFMTALINKIGMTNILQLDFESPFKRLYKQDVPMGSTVEEIYINPSVDTGFDTDGTKMLKTTTPDGKACYYGLNRKSTYPTTISKVQVERAFKSEESFMEFYNSVIASLKGGDECDEFLLGKKVLGQAIDNGVVRVLDASIALPEDTKELSKSISNISKSFTFANTTYCGYNLANKTAIEGGATPCITSCKKKNQVLFIRADADTEINYEVLAQLFHIPSEALQDMTILVDDIPSTKYEVYAVLADVASLQFRNVTYEITSLYNPSNLCWNFWLHHWQYIYLSMFGNCVAFGAAKSGGSTTPSV